jgi:hypothetical protein
MAFRTPVNGIAIFGLILLHCGCAPDSSRAGRQTASEAFVRITERAGLRFRHSDGATGKLYFPELMGGGCALADFTGDGLPDIYLVNGAPLPSASVTGRGRDAFYRNTGDGTFTDATPVSGLGGAGYGVGCCAGDYDGDGHLDLYVTNVGENRLYRNLGNGRFQDVTAAAGVGAGGFSAGAAFADYDGDGDLDLYVARYVVWSPERNRVCRVQHGDRQVRAHCRPVVYPAEHDILYRNNGDGSFTDVTRASGLRVPPGRGLGVIWSDIDGDGDQDLYVANDMSANHLFINQGGGTFREEAARRGAALDTSGKPQAGMGLAVADYDGDGHPDIACTNFAGEYLALYRNLGGGVFEDASARSGLTQLTSPYVGFGVLLQDLDLDGYPDLFVANGHVSATEDPRTREALVQPKLLLLNDARGGFFPASDPGPGIAEPRVGRGAAYGDADRDGALDVLVLNWTDAPDLLRNELPLRAGSPRGWIRLRLKGRGRNPFAIGARVELTSGGRTQVQEVRSGGSYCSQSELTLTFGLDAGGDADQVRVRWPDGARTIYRDLPAGREHLLHQTGPGG